MAEEPEAQPFNYDDTHAFRQDIYERTRRNEHAIGEVKTELSGLKRGVDDLGTWIKGLGEEMRANYRQSNRPFPVVPIISLLALLAALMGGYTNLITTPMKDSILAIDAKHEKQTTLALDAVTKLTTALDNSSKERSIANELSITRIREDLKEFALHGTPELQAKLAASEQLNKEQNNRLDHISDRLDGLLQREREQLEKTSYYRGKLDEMNQHLHNVDDYGPRKIHEKN